MDKKGCKETNKVYRYAEPGEKFGLSLGFFSGNGESDDENVRDTNLLGIYPKLW